MIRIYGELVQEKGKTGISDREIYVMSKFYIICKKWNKKRKNPGIHWKYMEY